MSKDWQKGSGYVQEPKIVKDPWSGKDGYSQAKTCLLYTSPSPRD